LAEDRLLDAKALLDASRWSGAYYLAGYATECALKSCVLAMVERTGIIFQDRKFSEKCFSHDFEALLTLAGLDAVLNGDCQQDHALGQNRLIVKDWKETSRYDQWTQIQAARLYNAVADNQNGVLQWIKNHW
jgi:hypothetical protein